jgi:hypothetical protein
MAGAKLATANVGALGTATVATVPADESWLVYTISLKALGPSGNAPLLTYFDSNDALTIELALTTSDPTGALLSYAGPSMVMNANDTLTLADASGFGTDFYCSGLIQRGPGPVPS